MKNLWAPWRMDYILSKKPKNQGCIFCLDDFDTKLSQNDLDRLVVYKGKEIFIMLNKYPYATGHLLLLPYRHIQDIVELTPSENLELMFLLQTSCTVLRKTCTPGGINMGVNLGEAAGAGIAEHLHFHIVPRWQGDSQFLAVISDTRLIPQSLAKTQEIFTLAFQEVLD